MDTRLWKFVGTSRRTDGVKTPGLVKFRFSNFPSFYCHHEEFCKCQEALASLLWRINTKVPV